MSSRFRPDHRCLVPLSILILAFGVVDRLEAITWTVSNTGSCSDKGTGTPLLPFCSLQVGVDHAIAGDIVEARGGTYGPAQLDVAVSGSAGAPIVIRSVPAHAAVIVGPPGAGETAGQGVRITGSYIVLQGFEVRDAAGTGVRNWGSYVTIRDNYVHDNARRCDATVAKCGQGIASNGSTPLYGVVIERNLSVHNGTGPAQDHGFYVSVPGAIVRNNVAVAASAFGFQIYPNCDGCLVYNNVAYGNTRNSGFLIGGDGSTNFSSSVKVYNNISAGNGGCGFWIYHDGNESITMRNNIAWNNLEGAMLVTSSIQPDNAVLLAVDPQLVDPARLDFHLRATSPAIDTGSAAYVPPDDIDGEPRYSGRSVDIGVDEYRLSAPPEVAADLRFINSTTLTWSSSMQAVSYALYRGALARWPWQFDQVCLQPSLGGAGAIDSGKPSAGGLLFYLVSGVNSAGEGTLGVTSSGVPRPNSSPCWP